MTTQPAGPWMTCHPCDVMWRGNTGCFQCGGEGVASNGPSYGGAATYVAPHETGKDTAA